MKQMLGDIEVLHPSCNFSTVKDGRGGIFTWIPSEPIVEFNMLYFHPSKIRGNHYHPEFTEYFLIVDGTVVMVTKNNKTGEEINMHASKGTCFKIPPNTAHAVHAITDSTCISMLTKEWDKSNPPIIHEDIIPFDKDYLTFVEEQKRKTTKE
jgi:dTDP-4-dehydrorhamnose 3,5-epimerase-like enzyme